MLIFMVAPGEQGVKNQSPIHRTQPNSASTSFVPVSDLASAGGEGRGGGGG